ncbi:MAG: transposase, partial [Synergistaceae bacterium]|nr:transposase [Synergistaceae bacterium]
ILDNASFHRKKRLYKIAELHNVKIIFLPPYSPELNPIEHFWHWLKKTTADTLKQCSNLHLAIFTSFQMW